MNAKPLKAEARFRRDEARLDDAGRTGQVPVAPTGVRLTTPFLRRTLELLKIQRPPLPAAPARSGPKSEAGSRKPVKPLATLADFFPDGLRPWERAIVECEVHQARQRA